MDTKKKVKIFIHIKLKPLIRLYKRIRKPIVRFYRKRVRRYAKQTFYYSIMFLNSIGLFDSDQKKVLSLKNQFLGQECFVVGNGPSLTKDDLERIKEKNIVCFASNKIYKIFEQTDWRPDFYSCIDSKVFEQNRDEILTQIECPIFLNHRFKEGLRKVPHGSDLKFLKYSLKSGPIKFYPDCRVVTSGGTVTYVLISLAWMMGFRKIYIIGCDHNYGAFSGRENVHQFEATQDTNNDYFVKNYMKPGEVMLVGDLQKAEQGFLIAKEFIEKNGGYLYNATRGGKLEVLERVSLDELLK